MKKILYASCGLALAALITMGLWSTGASPSPAAQATDPSITSQADAVLQDMTQSSELILTGRCIDTSTTWIEDGRVLVTLANISVDEVLKGAQSTTVTVVLPGGADLNRRIPVAMTYPGAPQIAPQEEVFLFLAAEDAIPATYAVSGFAEGKYSIVEDEEGQKLISRDSVKTRVKSGPGNVRGNRQFVPLSEFKQKVRGYLGQ